MGEVEEDVWGWGDGDGGGARGRNSLMRGWPKMCILIDLPSTVITSHNR